MIFWANRSKSLLYVNEDVFLACWQLHGVFFSGRRRVRLLCVTRVPRGSMGRLYIYLHEWMIFMVKVGKYILHDGSFGSHITYLMISTSVTYCPTKNVKTSNIPTFHQEVLIPVVATQIIFGVFTPQNGGSCSSILTGLVQPPSFDALRLLTPQRQTVRIMTNSGASSLRWQPCFPPMTSQGFLGFLSPRFHTSKM